MKSFCSVVTIATIMLFSQTVGVQIFVNPQPSSPTVTAAEIQALQADSKNSGRYVIVDVRDKVETDVSMIPGAITIEEFNATMHDHQGKAVIAYCTVGYRSEIYGEQLRSQGWNALNYQGSILDWCEHGLPVETSRGEKTKRVHTYDSSYALAAGYQQVY